MQRRLRIALAVTAAAGAALLSTGTAFAADGGLGGLLGGGSDSSEYSPSDSHSDSTGSDRKDSETKDCKDSETQDSDTKDCKDSGSDNSD